MDVITLALAKKKAEEAVKEALVPTIIQVPTEYDYMVTEVNLLNNVANEDITKIEFTLYTQRFMGENEPEEDDYESYVIINPFKDGNTVNQDDISVTKDDLLLSFNYLGDQSNLMNWWVEALKVFAKDGSISVNLETDKTLTKEDVAADAKTVGEKFNGINIQGSNSKNVKGAIKTIDSVFGSAERPNTKHDKYVDNYGYGSMAIGPYNKIFGAYSNAQGYNNKIFSTKAAAFGSTNVIGKPTSDLEDVLIGDFSLYLNWMNNYIDLLKIRPYNPNPLNQQGEPWKEGDGDKYGYWDNNDSTGYYHSNYPEEFLFDPSIGEGSFAAGTLNIIYSPNCFAAGRDNFIKSDPDEDGTYNTQGINMAIGYANKVFGNRNFTIGSYNIIPQQLTNTFLFGDSLRATDNSKHVIGRLNANKKGTIFEIGNGSHTDYTWENGIKSNAFEVYWDGSARGGRATTNEDDDLTLTTKGYVKSLLSNTGGGTQLYRHDFYIYFASDDGVVTGSYSGYFLSLKGEQIMDGWGHIPNLGPGTVIGDLWFQDLGADLLPISSASRYDSHYDWYDLEIYPPEEIREISEDVTPL
jgi:hypothetical protein